jgi:hypothetical protein
MSEDEFAEIFAWIILIGYPIGMVWLPLRARKLKKSMILWFLIAFFLPFFSLFFCLHYLYKKSDDGGTKANVLNDGETKTDVLNDGETKANVLFPLGSKDLYFSVLMRHPSLSEMKEFNALGGNKSFEMIKRCIQEVHVGETVNRRVDQSSKDLDDFIGALSSKDFKTLEEFFAIKSDASANQDPAPKETLPKEPPAPLIVVSEDTDIGTILYYLTAVLAFWGDGKVTKNEVKVLNDIFQRYLDDINTIHPSAFADVTDKKLCHQEFLLFALTKMKNEKNELEESSEDVELSVVKEFAKTLRQRLKLRFKGNSDALRGEQIFIKETLTKLAKADGDFSLREKELVKALLWESRLSLGSSIFQPITSFLRGGK